MSVLYSVIGVILAIVAVFIPLLIFQSNSFEKILNSKIETVNIKIDSKIDALDKKIDENRAAIKALDDKFDKVLSILNPEIHKKLEKQHKKAAYVR